MFAFYKKEKLEDALLEGNFFHHLTNRAPTLPQTLLQHCRKPCSNTAPMVSKLWFYFISESTINCSTIQYWNLLSLVYGLHKCNVQTDVFAWLRGTVKKQVSSSSRFYLYLYLEPILTSEFFLFIDGLGKWVLKIKKIGIIIFSFSCKSKALTQ